MIITIILTVIACQLILFILLYTNILDNEKVQIFLCGIWSLLFFIFVGGTIFFYRKIKLYNFNRKYVSCDFYTKEKRNLSAYVKRTEIHKLNTNIKAEHYIKITEKKAKNLTGINYRKNTCSSIINNLTIPPESYSADYFIKYMI
jgi:hypothetical protein